MVYKLREGTYEADQAGAALGDHINRWLTDFGPSPIFKTCESCHFMQKGGPAFCKRWNMTPPVEVILSSCDAYKDQGEIPFFGDEGVPTQT